MNPAEQRDLDTARTLGKQLGLHVTSVYERGPYDGWVIYGYWKEAPVAISLRGGLAGGISVAFWTGQKAPRMHANTPEDDATATNIAGAWHEILDTHRASVDADGTLGIAALEHYGTDIAATYAGSALPPTGNPHESELSTRGEQPSK